MCFIQRLTQTAFRVWLEDKYSNLDELNRAWGTVFWNQTYTDWAQIKLTGPTPSASPNPHQALDEKRFFSASAISFACLQSTILRELAPKQWVTTNGLFGHLDSHTLTEEALDFISYDSYPNFSTIMSDLRPGSDNPLKDRYWSWLLSSVRSVSPNFCVMEQQAGPGGWTNRLAQPAPKPGQLRLWTYQSVAHGADMVLYFRWRTATMGTEIYWHGLNDYHNRPNRRIAEAAQVGRELEALGSHIVGTQTVAHVGIVSDYDNEWDGELDSWHGPYTRQSVSAWFTALQHAHVPVDAVYLQPGMGLEALLKYQALIYPHPAILTDDTAALLTEYVRQGGKLVFGCRTGYKDLTGQCYVQAFPGPVAELCGVTVADFTRIGPDENAPVLGWSDSAAATDPTASADSFNDILRVEAPSAEVLAEYTGGYYAGAPALVQNRVGEGSAYYYGAVFNVAVATVLSKHLGLESPVAYLLELPGPVELCIREARAGERLIFLLNYSDAEQTVTMHQTFTDMLTGNEVQGSVVLAPFDVRVLTDSS